MTALDREPENAAGQDRLLQSDECLERQVERSIDRWLNGPELMSEPLAHEVIALVREQAAREIEGMDQQHFWRNGRATVARAVRGGCNGS